MKISLSLGAFLLLVLLVPPLASQGKPGPPPPFVEAQPPEGKALVYIVNSIPGLASPNTGYALFSQSGPVTLMRGKTYHEYVAEPGNLRFFAILTNGMAYGCRLEAIAGGIYYVRMSMGIIPDMSPMPREEALKELKRGYEKIY